MGNLSVYSSYCLCSQVFWMTLPPPWLNSNKRLRIKFIWDWNTAWNCFIHENSLATKIFIHFHTQFIILLVCNFCSQSQGNSKDFVETPPSPLRFNFHIPAFPFFLPDLVGSSFLLTIIDSTVFFDFTDSSNVFIFLQLKQGFLFYTVKNHAPRHSFLGC